MLKSYIRHGLNCLKQLFVFSLSLHQDVTHGFNAFLSIICWTWSFVSTRVGVIRFPSCTKPDSGITRIAVILFITKNANSCFRMGIRAHNIKPFLVAFSLQRGLWTNKRLPRVTTQWRVAVLPVSDQWVQRIALLIDDNEVDLLADLHTKTDLGEGCVPVAR